MIAFSARLRRPKQSTERKDELLIKYDEMIKRKDEVGNVRILSYVFYLFFFVFYFFFKFIYLFLN